MNADETIPSGAPIAQPDPNRFAGGSGPVTEYAALPDEPAETVAIAGAATDDLSAAELGVFDGDE